MISRTVALLACLGLSGTHTAPSVKARCGTDADLTARLVALVRGAERARLLAGADGSPASLQLLDDTRMRIVVDDCPVATSVGLRFYNVHNAHLDPPVTYVVAVDRDGALHRVFGFDTSEYDVLIRRLFQHPNGLSNQDALALAMAHFAALEGWRRPGMILSPPQLAATAREFDRAQGAEVRRQVEGRCGATPVVRRMSKEDGVVFEIRGALVDVPSGRVECVTTELSLDGVLVLARLVLVDRPRVAY